MKKTIAVAVNLAITVLVCVMTVGVSSRVATAASSVISTAAGTGVSGYSGDGGQATAAKIAGPNGVAVDSSGNVYFADLRNSRIRKITVATGVISTVAGNGTAGYAGDNGPAISAKLNEPNGVAVDSSGNLYISDWLNNRIRKVTAGGTITTVAGSGTAGFSGDNGAATAANINNPSGVALDGSGNIYIADNSNRRVRKVTAGTITTVAGTGNIGYSGDGSAATSANLSPFGVAIDGSGNILIADATNHCIRKVTVATGIISTVTGTGSPGFAGDNSTASGASLNAPGGVSIAGNGDIYISDSANNRIRKITALTGVISTVAGNGNATYSGDNGPATSASIKAPNGTAVSSDGKLYIADYGNDRVRLVAISDFTLTASIPSLSVLQGASDITDISTVGSNGFNAAVDLTVSGVPTGATASFSQSSIAAPGSGSSTLTLTAGAATPPGTYTVTVTGTGGGMTHSATISFTVSAAPNYSLAAAPGTVTITQGGSGTATIGSTVFSGFNAEVDLTASGVPAGVTATFQQNSFAAPGSGSTTLTLADNGNTPTGTYPITVTGTTVGGMTRTAPVSLMVAPFGTIITIAGNSSSGYAGDNVAATQTSLGFANGVAVDGSGNVFIADYVNNRVRMVNAASGIITTVAGTGATAYSGDNGAAVAATLSLPSGVAVDGSGNIFIADTGNNVIRKITASTGVITTVAGNGTAANSGNGGPATAASLNFPAGVALDGSGNIFIADAGNNVIRKVTVSSGIITIVAGNGTGAYAGDGGSATAASLNFPEGIAIDSAGNMYIADTFNSRVRKVTGGNISSLAGTGTAGYSGDGASAASAKLSSPTGVKLDSAGDVYIADAGNNRIRKITVATGMISTVAGNGSAGFSGDGGPAAAASLNNPSGLAVDASKNIYIADSNNSRIREVFTSTLSPNFSISAASPSSAAQGAATNTTVSTTVRGGFNAAVSLSASGLPAGATAVFSPASIAAPGSGSSTLTLTAGVATTAGTYSVTITGTGGSTTHSVTISFTVTSVSGGTTITPSAGAGGTVSPSTPQTVSSGSASIFTVIPVPGYHITSVTGCGGSLAGITYTTAAFNGSCTVTALFAKSDVVFNEFAYLQANSDVAAAVKSGAWSSGWAHYLANGRSEGRSLTPVGYGSYREVPYLLANPDVAGWVKSGLIDSGWIHYQTHGIYEGRPLEPTGFNNFSEEAYLAANPDVAAAVKSGARSSGWAHYLATGKSEGRSLSPVDYGSFSEEAYLLVNTDVAGWVKSGLIDSGWVHYQTHGKYEGRLVAPVGYVIFNEAAYLAANPDVAAWVKSGLIDSGWTHYQNHGTYEGRPLAPTGYANFSEAAYLAANPDVALAVKAGGAANGWSHYRDYGKGEGRPLNPAGYGSFNESDYLAANPDVAAWLNSGLIDSGWTHYQTHGIYEGRKLRP